MTVSEFLFLIFLLILLIVIVLCKKHIEKLDKKYRIRGIRKVSVVDLIAPIMFNIIFALMMFFMIITLYALICVDNGLITLFEINDYLSFIPLLFHEGDVYPTPVNILRHLDKLNFNPFIIGALIINLLCSFFASRVIIREGRIQITNTHEIITLVLNAILWFISPYSLTISLFLYQIILVAVILISRIEVIIEEEMKTKNT